MTLGFVFSKLSGITLRSIAKLYGILVFCVVGTAVVMFVGTGVVMILWGIINGLGFWGTLGMVALIAGIVSIQYFKSEIFPDSDPWEERYMREVSGTVRKESAPVAKVVNNWQEIRDIVAMMSETQACHIVFDGEEYNFDTRQEALDFLDGKAGAVKS